MTRTLLALALATASIGCTASVADEAVDDLGSDVDDPAGKEDGVVRPLGTFDIVEDGFGIQQVTLFTDKSYHMVERLQVRCAKAPCNPITRETDGTYRYTKSGRSRYIRFTEADTTSTERYRYTYSATNDSLRLTHIDSDGNAAPRIDLELNRGGYCSTDARCTMQDLPAVRCFGATHDWRCTVDNVCVPSAACLQR